PELVMGRSDALTTDPGLEIAPAISPDGRLVAYSAGNSTRMRIYIRPVGGGRTIPLSDDSTAVEMQARWSSDGQSLLFLTRGGVSVAPALGGSSRAIVAPAGSGPVTAAAWSPDGREIAFARGDTLQVVPLAGGDARPLATAFELHSCTWSPDGAWIACVSGNRFAVQLGASFGNLAPTRILLVPVAGGEPVELAAATASNMSPAWGGDGRHLYFLSTRDGPSDIYAQALTGSGRARGEPVRLTTGLGASAISFSTDHRRMAYSVYTAQSNLWALPIPTGAATGVERAVSLTSGRQVVEAMRVSPDGQWLVYDSDLRGNPDIYRLPLAGGSPEQLTSAPAAEFGPDLSPDGRRVAYHSWRTGTRDIEVKPLDGGPVERVTDTPAQESYPVWSPDGNAIVYVDQVVPAAVWVARRDGAGAWSRDPAPLVSEATLPVWSPDGAWVAYIEGARHPNSYGPIAIVPSAGGTPRRLFTPGPDAPMAAKVQWSPDGRTVYFKSFDEVGRASFWAVSAGGGMPRLLVAFTDPDRQSLRADFATDGRRCYVASADR
ncbi:MAG: PD40 domain-containing protein, partial [Gemmatimonadales bacterium]|nr:PD40 domain-containing protein [Gemmatimonadales bacterium]